MELRIVTRVALLGLALVAGSTAEARAQATYAASGYAAKVSTLLGQLTAAPSTQVANGSNFDEGTLANAGVPGALSSGLLTAISTGATDPAVTGAQTTSTLANISVLNGLIVARQLVASTSSTLSDGVAQSDAAGSSFDGLRVGGTTFGSQMPAPNTRINLPGVGYVLLNQQLRSGDGVNASAITVNLIRVVLTNFLGVKTGEIILGSSSSSVRR